MLLNHDCTKIVEVWDQVSVVSENDKIILDLELGQWYTLHFSITIS